MGTETFVGTTVIETRGDSDWLRVHLTAGTVYTYYIDVPNGFYFEAKLLNADSTPVAMARPFSNAAYFTVPTTGDYFFAVEAEGNSPIGIPVTITSVDDALPGAIFTTGAIAVGQTLSVANEYMINQNQDWFGVDLVGGQSYALTTSDPNSGGGSAGTTFFVDAAGQVVGNGQHFTAPSSGHYFAAIEPRSNVLNYQFSLNTVADDHPDLIGYAGTLTVGSSATGTFETAGDRDYFAITLDANTSYRLGFASSNQFSSGSIVVTDASGNVVWDSASHHAYANPTSIFTSTVAGTYYVGVAGSSTTYSVSATAMPDDIPDNVSTVRAVTVGAAPANGSWELGGDHDWFKVDLVQGQSYDFGLITSNTTYNFAASQFTGLALYGSDGHLIQLVSGAYSQADLTYTARTTGSYYISANGGEAASYSVAAVSYADDYADNASTTGRLTVGGSVTGQSETSADIDWFAVDLLANHTYMLGGAAGAFLDAAGTVLTTTNVGDLTFTPVTSGTYYITASDYTGTYTASVTEVFDDNLDNASTRGVLYQQFNGTTGADVLNGTDYPSLLNGMGGDDLLTGGASNDQVNGGDGNDTLYGRGGDDTLNGGNDNDLLLGEDGNDVLLGGSGDDTLYGGSGNDTLNGGTGADDMFGGIGDDTYTIDNVGDRVTESPGEGTDTVRVSLASYVLPDNVERLSYSGTGTGATSLSGNAGDNSVTGGNGNDMLNGLGGNDTLSGGAGNDRLDGGTGDDRMVGGSGNDTYVVDSGGDTVIENTNGGTDTVLSTITYSLVDAPNVENLTLTGTANIDGYGDANNNILTGNSGDNYLSGGGGTDTLIGGAGNDSYVVDSADDLVIENPGEGVDSIKSLVDYSIATQFNIEVLRLVGTANLNATGNTDVNKLVGNDGDNILDGGGGGDVLRGGLGNDTYIIRDAADRIVELQANGTADVVRAAVSYTITADAWVETLQTIDAAATTAIDLTGNDHTLVIQGNAGANVLVGGAGGETISGFAGNDTLIGGGGNDVFAFTLGTGQDSVGDFVSGSDRLDLSVFFSDFAQVQATTHDVGGNAVIDLGNGDSVTLSGFLTAQLQSGDLILGEGGGAAPFHPDDVGKADVSRGLVDKHVTHWHDLLIHDAWSAGPHPFAMV